MKLKKKILICLLCAIAVFSIFSNCFAVQNIQTNKENYVELPDFPFDINSAFPGRNYYMRVLKNADETIEADLYILPTGYYYKKENTTMNVYDSNGTKVSIKCDYYYYRSSYADGWHYSDTGLPVFSILPSMEYGYISNVDIKDGSGNVVFPLTLTGVLLIQTQAGEAVRQGIMTNLGILVPIGLIIFSSLLMVYLIACRKWLMM